MIEGLKFGMASQELKSYLGERVTHHRERAAWYRKKADELTAGGVTSANITGGDPVGAMNTKAKQHEQGAALFQFMHDHVIPDETYQLGDSDLTRLEIISRGW